MIDIFDLLKMDKVELDTKGLAQLQVFVACQQGFHLALPFSYAFNRLLSKSI